MLCGSSVSIAQRPPTAGKVRESGGSRVEQHKRTRCAMPSGVAHRCVTYSVSVSLSVMFSFMMLANPVVYAEIRISTGWRPEQSTLLSLVATHNRLLGNSPYEDDHHITMGDIAFDVLANVVSK